MEQTNMGKWKSKGNKISAGYMDIFAEMKKRDPKAYKEMIIPILTKMYKEAKITDNYGQSSGTPEIDALATKDIHISALQSLVTLDSETLSAISTQDEMFTALKCGLWEKKHMGAR
jgi:hypothetical protein